MQKASVGGVLGIVASVLGMLGSLFFFALPVLMESSGELGDTYEDAMLEFIMAFYVILGIIGLILGIVGIVGGAFAIRRRVFGLALAGAIISSVLFYPLGIVSVVLVSMGYPEFRGPAPAAYPQTPSAI
jgi:hypothetical protein